MFAQLGYYICVPFAWLTRLFYTWTGSYGVALIFFTLIVKLILLPFQLKSKKSMLRMGRMNSKVEEIKKKYPNNQQRQQQEIADLYAREGVNPMSGCLWSFLPFPILIALYYIIRTPLRYFMNLSENAIAEVTKLAVTLGYQTPEKVGAYDQIYLTKFIHENWAEFAGKFDKLIDVDYSFLGMDLSSVGKDLFGQFPSGGWPVIGILLLPLISAALQFLMSMISMKSNGNNQINGTSKTMLYMMPLMTVWMGYILPAALCVYWIANAGFSCIQEQLLNSYFNKRMDAEETEKEKLAREKRLEKYEKQREMMLQRQNQGKQPPQPSKKKQQAHKEAASEKRASTTEAGRVGQRPYARGRAYSEGHYDDEE